MLEIDSVPVAGYARLTSKLGHGLSIALWRDALAIAGDADVVHVHGLFSAANAILLRAARRCGKAVVVSPHGSCMGSALSYGRRRKLTYLYLLGRRQLQSAGVHVTSELEARSVRRLAPAAKVFVVPPGAPRPAGDCAVPRNPRQVLFLGRYHPIKRFDLLLDAMSRVTRSASDVELVIAGPGPAAQREIAAEAARLEPHPRVSFRGFVEGPEKWSLLRSVAGLVLTSDGESFGQVVLEALTVGTPVITTQRTPWAELEATGAGWWVEHQASAVAKAVAELLDPEHPDRSTAARALAETFSWRRAAEAFDEHYRSVGA